MKENQIHVLCVHVPIGELEVGSLLSDFSKKFPLWSLVIKYEALVDAPKAVVYGVTPSFSLSPRNNPELLEAVENEMIFFLSGWIACYKHWASIKEQP